MIAHRYNPDTLTKSTTIPLGRACECYATRIEFDVSAWLARFPGGTIVLYVKDPNGELYLAKITVADGVASWTLQASDTKTPGYGNLELALIGANGAKKLSAVATTHLGLSLIDSEEAPDYATPWLEQAAEMQAVTETASRAAAEHAATATTAAAQAAASANSATASETAAAGSAAAAAQSAKEAADTLAAVEETVARETKEAVQAIGAQEAASIKAVNDAATPAAENAEAASKSAENAATSAENAEQSADRAEMAATASGWFDVGVNEAGHLIYTRSETVDAIDFEMQKGRLIVNYA